MLSTLQPQFRSLVLTHDIPRPISRRLNARAFPPLPNELIHLIFEFAATQHYDACKTLCLVSHGARMVVLPYLMKTIVILEENHWILDKRTWITHVSSGDLWVSPTAFTKNLYISPTIGPDTDPSGMKLLTICSRCPNANNIALSGDTLQQIMETEAHRVLQSCTFQITVHDASNPKHHQFLVTGPNLRHPFLDRIKGLRLDEVPDSTVAPLDLRPFRSLDNITLGVFDRNAEHLESLVAAVQDVRGLRRIAIALPIRAFSAARNAPVLLDIVRDRAKTDSRLISVQIKTLSWRRWYQCTVEEGSIL